MTSPKTPTLSPAEIKKRLDEIQRKHNFCPTSGVGQAHGHPQLRDAYFEFRALLKLAIKYQIPVIYDGLGQPGYSVGVVPIARRLTRKPSPGPTMADRARVQPIDPNEAKHLARKGTWQTRLALASNPTCPPYVLERLIAAPDKAGKIWGALRANPSTPSEVLKRLTEA